MKSFRKKNLAFSTSPGASNAYLQAICQNNALFIGRCYLFVYNLFMFCGFLYALIVMSLKYSADQEGFPAECWKTVGNIFKFLHLLMYLEVLPIVTKKTNHRCTLNAHICIFARCLTLCLDTQRVLWWKQPSRSPKFNIFLFITLSGDWKKHLDICSDRQRAENANQACCLLPLYDLLNYRDIQVTGKEENHNDVFLSGTPTTCSAFMAIPWVCSHG